MHTHRIPAAVLPTLAAIALSACDNSLMSPRGPDAAGVAPPPSPVLATSLTGNGMPSGAHYNLNVIGTKDKSPDMTGGDGHRIFVPLTGSTKIMLSPGDFQVLDANGTDGSAAFQLPNPDPNNTGVTEYSVWVRALAKPGGSASANTCATDPLTGDLYCSVYTTVDAMTRSTGKPVATNVSKELLYVYQDINGDGTIDRVPLFDSRLQDYYWGWSNTGLKLAQLRFYQVSTVVP